MSKRLKYAKVNIASITAAVITAALIFSTLLTGCTKGQEVTPEPAQQEEGFTPLTEEALAEIEKSMEYPRLPEKQEEKPAEPLPEKCYTSKKGMQVNELIVEDAIDLGIEWGFVNFYFNELISAEPTEYEYTYKGRTYYFNAGSLETSDYMISRMTDEGIKVMAAVVSGYNEDLPELRYPGIDHNPGTQYYAFNVKTQEGIDMIEGVMSFLLERYDGSEHGYVTDWLVGNEVNDNLQYNYIGPCDGETYVSEYYEQFKVFYNIIRKYNKTANVYIPMEHRWNTANTMTDYGGKWFLEYFHECELKDQEMDWGLAWHPYPYPLGDADTLDDGDEPTTDTDGQPTWGGEVTMEYTSPLVSMKNIHVITDYLSENLLTKDGKVRSIICSEVGYTSYSVLYGENQSKQAANIALALTKAQMNPYIDAFVIRCQLDISEGSPYFQFGLREDAEGRYLDKKLAFDVYKYLDSTKAEEKIKDCLPVLGIEKWEDVIEGYDPAVYEGMTDYTEGQIYRSSVAEKTDEQTAEGHSAEERAAEEQATAGLKAAAYISVTGAYEDNNYDDMMYRCYFMDSEAASGFDGIEAVGFEIEKISGNAKGSLKARIRVRSGKHILEAEGVLNPEDSERFILPLNGWEHAGDIDNIELWLNDADTELKYDAEYAVKGFLLGADDAEAELAKSEDITLSKPAKKDVNSLTFSGIPDLTYNGAHQRPEVTVKDGDKTLADGTDYCISYANDKEAGTASAVIQGIGGYEGTHVIEYNIVCEYGDVFDPVYYLVHNTDLHDAYGDDTNLAYEHFIACGMSEGRRGCKDFSPLFYMENYPDLRAAYGNDYVKYYLHYKNVGKEEGRIGSRLINSASYNGTDYTAVYDAAYYAALHWDYFNAADKNEYMLIRHFVEEGMAAGERGNEEFDVSQYKDAHPELAKEYGDDLKAYYMHYIEEGAPKGESGTPAEEPVWSADQPLTYRGKDLSYVYDPEYYAAHYEDAAVLKDDPEALIRQFVIYGMKEGRRGNYEFDPRLYMARYSDVRDSYANLVEFAYSHYINYGREEGR